MNIILVSIDGFGIGKMKDTKIKANTWQTVTTHSTKSDFTFLKKISKNWQKLALDYNGADSYLGHLTMSGIETKKLVLHPLSFYFSKIKKLLNDYNYQFQITDGMIEVKDKFLIYDNFEAEQGLAINVAGISDLFPFEKQIIISKKIRQIIKNPRLISFSAKKIKMQDYLSHSINNGSFYGVLTPKTGVYNNTFKVMHLPAINDLNSSFQYKFAQKNWKVFLYGKFANIIKIKNQKNIVANQEINSQKIFLNLENNLKEKTLHCVNIQQTDLAGHSGDISKYILELNKIDPWLEKLSEEKNNILIITSDHGNDPFIKDGKHTREYVPFWINKKDYKINVLSEIADYINKFI